MDREERLNALEEGILEKIAENGLSSVNQNEMQFLIYCRLRELTLETVEEASALLPPNGDDEDLEANGGDEEDVINFDAEEDDDEINFNEDDKKWDK